LEATRLTDLSGHLVDELSGGQRQRVWVATLLAQDTPIMLLDEPTTFLDIAHQYELMELFRDFHEDGRSLVAVLHDLGQAARYADHLVVMRDGRVVATGPPHEIITAQLIEDVFGLRCLVVPDPVTGTPSVVPLDPRAAPPVPVEPVDLVADRNGRDPTTGGPSMTRRERSAFTGPNRTGEQRLSFQPKLVRRDLTVARVEDITPRYRRIVLTGEVLAEGYPFVRFACNDHVKAYFP